MYLPTFQLKFYIVNNVMMQKIPPDYPAESQNINYANEYVTFLNVTYPFA